MAHPVLHEDWSEYDNKKIRDGRDRSKFSCEEAWEREYLINKLEKHFPHKTRQHIKDAIEACCRASSERERTAFVTCVTGRL